jgi:DNA (cytosine-5)-methyltransferase 1
MVNSKKRIETDDESVYFARTEGHGLRHGRNYRLIDLFSGAGGLSLGFSAAFGHVFKPVWACDSNPFAAKTYNLNFGNHCVVGDIVNILNDASIEIPAADVVIGGPPCQGFSLLNRNRESDSRKQLWRPFLDIVDRSGAKVFVMENVPQLLGSLEHGEIIEAAESLGFKLAWGKLCAADYGVPQTRSRAFIIGCRTADPSKVFPPKRTHFNPNGKVNQSNLRIKGMIGKNALRWSTVRDAISDLPKPKGTSIKNEPPPMDLHFGRKPTELRIARYLAIPNEGMNRFDLQKNAPELTPECWIRKKSGGTDLFGRLWWDKPAYTIRTEFFKPEKGRYLHPEQNRPITHREAARFQSFPDFFKFEGSKIEIAIQIGNAVPPLLAARIADCVYTLLASKSR